MDPMEATKVFLSKWVLHAFELGDSNIQEFVRFKPRGFQLHKGGKRALGFEWCVEVNHKRTSILAFWNRVERTKNKMAKELKHVNPSTFKDVLVVSFWWNVVV